HQEFHYPQTLALVLSSNIRTVDTRRHQDCHYPLALGLLVPKIDMQDSNILFS
ncbi:hypothetical protein J6590_093165, partial [Homalodisca vitripennis]